MSTDIKIKKKSDGKVIKDYNEYLQRYFVEKPKSAKWEISVVVAEMVSATMQQIQSERTNR